jgi:microcystin-dependent protein
MPLLLGSIVIWSGSTLDIPEGWALCDGQNGTPDLRNRFIIGAGNTYNVGDTGGNADAVLVTHTHTGSTDTSATHLHGHSRLSTTNPGTNGRYWFPVDILGTNTNTGAAGAHTHTVDLETVGEDPTNKNLPPYFALCYIQQIS